jgi:hypothetical protein
MAVPFYFTDQYTFPTQTLARYYNLKNILHESVFFILSIMHVFKSSAMHNTFTFLQQLVPAHFTAHSMDHCHNYIPEPMKETLQ